MKSVLSRVHLHHHKEPNGRAYIVGDKKGLLALAETIQRAASSGVGLDTLQLFSSDGHAYEIMVVSGVDEQEWQQIPLPYEKASDPSTISCVKIYDSLKSELSPAKV